MAVECNRVKEESYCCSEGNLVKHLAPGQMVQLPETGLAQPFQQPLSSDTNYPDFSKPKTGAMGFVSLVQPSSMVRIN